MISIKNFLKDENGLELSEYAVAAALVIGTVIVIFTGLGQAIAEQINKLGNTIKNGS